MAWDGLKSYIYISHLDEDYRFWQLPVIPDTLNDSMQSSFQSTSALGRTAPVYTYSNSGPRSLQITLKLNRDIMDDVNIGISNATLQSDEDYVDNLIKALQSIALPRYNLKNSLLEPPMVAVRFEEEIFIKGIVNGDIGVTYDKPILENGKFAQVTISFTVSEVDPYDATSVFKNGSFRGVVNTLKTRNMGFIEKDL